jgi:release factor glutamine methyltransferase
VVVAGRSLIDVLRLSTAYLAEHGSASPRLDAELLCAHALRMRRLDVYLQFDRPLREEELAAVRELVRRRGRGEPVAYLTGEREFYGRPFAVTPAVLIPRPETETLVDAALQALRAGSDGRGSVRIADLGTGSGCIAVTLAAELPDITVVATDLSADALQVAQENARRHGVSDRVMFALGSWGDALDGAVDVIVSNPPYVTTDELNHAQRDVRDFEPHLALAAGPDGLDPYRAMLASLHGKLRPGGRLLLEIDPRRAVAVEELIAGVFAAIETALVRDLAGHDRVVVATLPSSRNDCT